MRDARIFWLCAGMALLIATCSAAGQRTATKPQISRGTVQAGTRVEVASNAGPPGTVVVLPIYFTPEKGVDVGRLRLQIRFPSGPLKFEKVERGKLPSSIELNHEATVSKDGKGGGAGIVIITASVAAPENAPRGIPAGMLASLSLRIGDKAAHGNLPLRVGAEAAELGTNRELRNVRANAARVEVQWVDAPPSVNCFFFSH